MKIFKRLLACLSANLLMSIEMEWLVLPIVLY